MGRASNRKKAQRQSGGPNLRRINQDARSQAAAARPAFSLDAIVQFAGERVRRRSIALQAWLGDTEPTSAETPSWPKGSLGHRLLAGTRVGEAQDAPSLLTAKLPDAQTIAADPAHWTIATEALIRAVVFDGLSLGHPAVSALLEVLTPVVEDEIDHMRFRDDDDYSIGPFDNDHEIGFPVLDGPVLLLGRALTEAAWATVGDDSIADVDDVLEVALDGVVPDLDGPSLVGVLDCDNPLETLAVDDEVPPRDILPAGLLMLSTLARLCQSSSHSVLQRAPDLGALPGSAATPVTESAASRPQSAANVVFMPNGSASRPAQPPPVDPDVPSPARVWNVWLGGTDNFPVDRELAGRIQAAMPSMPLIARFARLFLADAVRRLSELGIRQFLDIGSGVPTADNTHQVAQRLAPESRIVYADRDPAVAQHAWSLLSSTREGKTDYLHADLRDPEGILAEAARTLDLTRSVGVLLIAVLHFIPDADDPYGTVGRLMAGLPSGSYLVVAHAASDLAPEAAAEMTRRNNQTSPVRITPRTQAEVTRFFDGLDLMPPGVVPVSEWDLGDAMDTTIGGLVGYVGIGRKP